MNPCDIPVLSFFVGDDPNDRMSSSKAWLAMTLVPIPYAQRRTIGPGDTITMLNGGEAIKARGASRSEALENLQRALSELLGALDQVAIGPLTVNPIPRANPSSV